MMTTSASQPVPEIRKVLVANRGEIAWRIVRTLREMSLASVAVYSDADAESSHVEMADEAVRLGPAPSAESYLNMDAVLAAAKRVGAQAIHPGYGFLSENAEFAARCADAGLVFIGPSPKAIAAMGDKARAKAIAKEAGVPVLPGANVDLEDLEAAREQADAIGYPLLVKAVAGGGGKGMRTVTSADDLPAALEAASREATNAFGNGALMLEKQVASPRHVEIQILADSHGHVVHLGERDCSVQRRHQKVFEESPSPAVDDALRQRMGDAAIALAQAVDYVGAGTVEFLLDADGLLDSGGQFYFLEMNTRLQVEHPVTEMVTGLDLVELQVDIAQGLPLPFTQDDVQLKGHAIEARLYAEDPSNDFLPVTGRISLWDWDEAPGCRIDYGVGTGDEIGIHYDPMLAKLIAHGRHRDEALRRLRRSLERLAVGGLTTNRDFLLQVVEHDAFRQGDFDTGFIDTHFPASERQTAPDAETVQWHAIATTLLAFEWRRQHDDSPVPSTVPGGWRNNRWRPQELHLQWRQGNQYQLVKVQYVVREENRFDIRVTAPWVPGLEEATSLDVHLDDCWYQGITFVVDGVRRELRAGRYWDEVKGQNHFSIWGLNQISDQIVVPRFPERQASAVVGGSAAPMTGRVLKVNVAEGDRVAAGDVLLVLEAMKMEHPIQAQADGTVTSVRVEAGKMVDPDDVLVVVDADEDEGGSSP